jgi:hypothetical protein
MFKRPFALGAIAAAVSLIASVAQAQGNPFAGSWRSVMNINGTMVEFDLVIQPNMAFSEQQRSGGGMTMQTGQIQPTGQNIVTFVVEDWEPKTMPSYSFGQECPGAPCWHQIPTTKPPGGTWSYRFNNANSLSMHDMYLGGDITYQRVG